MLPEALAGATLAALAVPEVLGYARIAGMPVVTGLYTMLAPMVVFAVLCSSRHLVVAADSATAALLLAGLTGLAAAGSPRYVALAGTVALVVAVLLVLARVVGVGFLANFLSRTVLVGFLTGVGITVAIGQLGDLLGVDPGSGDAPERLVQVLSELPHAHLPTVLVGGAVILVVLAGRLVDRRVPVALLAVVAAIAAEAVLGLSAFGVAVLGPVPSGVPGLVLPALAPADLAAAVPGRRLDGRRDPRPERGDLAGLRGAVRRAGRHGRRPPRARRRQPRRRRSRARSWSTAARRRRRWWSARAGAARSRSSPRSSWSASCARWPPACWAGCRWPRWPPSCSSSASNSSTSPGCGGSWPCGGDEFVVAVLTALAVVVLGVEEGIVVAVVVSIIDHLRHSYAPRSSVLVKSPAGHWRSLPVAPGTRTAEGLLVYRFGSGLYFANVSRLVADLVTIGAEGPPVRWLCLDAAAVGDVDYTAAAVLTQLVQREQRAGVRVVLSNVVDGVRAELDRYGITALIGADGIFDTSGEVLAAYGEPD